MRLKHSCNSPAYAGQTAVAEIIAVDGSYARNSHRTVYRVSEFRIPGVSGGWRLMNREYTTLDGLKKAAAKMGIKETND
jgi:hypothetical protein